MKGLIASATFLAALAALSVPGVTSAEDLAASQANRVDITIQDGKFLYQSGHLQPGATVVVVRNQDIVRHGFTSDMLPGLSVTSEAEGVATYGKGVKGFYVDPGKTLVIRFDVQRGEKTSAFRCDLHQDMKGEFYTLAWTQDSGG